MKDHHQQQQTYVTKHDLNLLHKKIIATDLIVQKYQDANKALLRLQTENDDYKQQIEQITNECCIFGKQVTECTQECDHLKEQIDILNSEKRELHQQLRVLQDENTNNYHEIMVLRQYESLKQTNDHLSKTVERQQKQVAKLQLQVQRKMPIVYKSNKDKNEPSETDIALKTSQKSVRELKLALARLMNFIQSSKIEVPTALHIRPVLKAHDINDDFLEMEGEYVLKPVKKRLKPVISQADDDDDDDDDDHGDFIDITHNPVQHEPVNIPNPPVDVIETTPKSSSRQQPKKKEVPKTKPTKKPASNSRRKKVASISEDPSEKLDDLANELEIALSQTNQEQPSQNMPHMASFLSDDDDEDRIHKSDTPSLPIPMYIPTILQTSSKSSQKTNSTITMIDTSAKKRSRVLSFSSDDEYVQEKSATITVQQTVSTLSTLQVDSITAMDVDTSNKPTKYMSCLSEDDDDNRSLTPISTPINERQPIYQEYISPLDLNSPIFNNETTIETQSSDKQIPMDTVIADLVQAPLLSNPQVETMSENDQNSSSNGNIQTESSIIANTLDSNRIKIISHLLNILTQPPIPLKRLRLIQCRTKDKTIPEKQITLLRDNTSNDKHEDSAIVQTSKQSVPELMEQQIFIEENIFIMNDKQDNGTFLPSEDQPVTSKENNTMIEEISNQQNDISIDEHSKLIIKNTNTVVDIPVNVTSAPLEEELIVMDKYITENNDVSRDQVTTISTEVCSTSIMENNVLLVHEPEIQTTILTDQQLEVSQELDIVIDEAPKDQTSISIQENLKPAEEQNPLVLDIQKKPAKHTRPNQQSKITKPTSTKPLSQEYEPYAVSIAVKQSLLSSTKPVLQPVLEHFKQPLKPFQISVITRLLHVLTELPVKPLTFRIPYPSQKRKEKVVVSKPPVIRSERIPPTSSNRMQTRSFNSIRSCIARCNQPAIVNRKRTATESMASLPPIPKRMKSIRNEQQIQTNEYDLIHKFIDSLSKEINDDTRNFLQRKLHEDILLFNDNIYRIFSDLMFSKCDIILLLVKELHVYEESIRTLLVYIHSQSSVFQQHFITKLTQAFEFEIQKQSIQHNQIKILNRLFFLTNSIFATSSIAIYARLFDIGYYLSHDILVDALKFTSIVCSSLISNDSQKKSSSILLHQLLFDILQSNQFNISFEYLENLLITYHRYTRDHEDLIRCFVIISRHQSWSLCSSGLCAKFLFPLLSKIDDEYQQRFIILTILQYVLFTYKDNQDFRCDINFHDQIKQLLLSLKTINSSETTVRDKILFILHTCY
ncbi:unnamed protein product [Rotaria magnacalcarata]|uniref:Uncharacterized protein n=1 Tax=Rotaria magnacalcarata TaxID=392030 RepID=A0A816WX98_9BILA|nr:unnamed protein product [Rotaria magnacalcarata]